MLYEGFGFPILEAMSCGIPVITANSASMPEAAGDAAILVDPYDVDAIAAAMTEITTNLTLKDSLIAKGYDRLEMFSWRQCAEQTLHTLRRALTA
jgi:glycosyltransferase involved in cell wall biosynthesis